MGFEYSKVNPIINQGLDGRVLRNRMIASNIANVDTPFYRSKDVDFETALSQEADKLLGDYRQKELPLAKTSPMHLNPLEDTSDKKGTVFYRDGHLVRNVGNTVDLDIETTELSKNTMMFNILMAAKSKNGMIFRSVLDASAKTS